MNPIEAARAWIKSHGVIEADLYEPHPEKPGFIRLVSRRTYSEVWPRIRAAIQAHDADLSIEYVSGLDTRITPSQRFPEGFRWCVYLVEGANEGYYLHVEVVIRDTRIPIGLVKTLGAWEDALRILNFTTVLLHQRW